MNKERNRPIALSPFFFFLKICHNHNALKKWNKEQGTKKEKENVYFSTNCMLRAYLFVYQLSILSSFFSPSIGGRLDWLNILQHSSSLLGVVVNWWSNILTKSPEHEHRQLRHCHYSLIPSTWGQPIFSAWYGNKSIHEKGFYDYEHYGPDELILGPNAKVPMLKKLGSSLMAWHMGLKSKHSSRVKACSASLICLKLICFN